MSIRVSTENSTYELDASRMLIRRVSGVDSPTECFAPDGDWKLYRGISFLEVGRRAQIVWPDEAPHQFTVLSVIQELEELETEEPTT